LKALVISVGGKAGLYPEKSANQITKFDRVVVAYLQAFEDVRRRKLGTHGLIPEGSNVYRINASNISSNPAGVVRFFFAARSINV